MSRCRYCSRPVSRKRAIGRPEGFCYDSGGVACLRVALASACEERDAHRQARADELEQRLRAEMQRDTARAEVARLQELLREISQWMDDTDYDCDDSDGRAIAEKIRTVLGADKETP